MKYVKMIGLAAVAAIALMAFVASSASATVIEATLTGSAVLEETGGTTLDTCTGSTVSGKTSEREGAPLKGTIETLDWSNCIVPTDTLVNGSFTIEKTSGGNGTVTGSRSKVTVGIFG